MSQSQAKETQQAVTYINNSYINQPPSTYTTYTQGQPITYSTTQYATQGLGQEQYISGGNQNYSNVNQAPYGHATYQSGLVQGYTQISGNGSYQRPIADQIPVQSRIQYIPFEKKYVEYDQIEYIEKIPYTREIVTYEEVTKSKKVPIQRTITDYYAVETQIEYIPKQIEETIVQYQPVERVWERIQYLPVQTQIVHYPERDNYIPQQGQFIQKYVDSGSKVNVGSRIQQNSNTYVSGGNYGTTTYTTGGYSAEQYATGGSQVRRQQNVIYEGNVGGTTTYTTGYPTGGSQVRRQETATYITGGNIQNPGNVIYTTGGYINGNYNTSGSRTGQKVTYTTTTGPKQYTANHYTFDSNNGNPKQQN